MRASDKQTIHHFVQIARDQGIEVVGEVPEPIKGLYGFERDPRIDICNLLKIDWEKWADEEIERLANENCNSR